MSLRFSDYTTRPSPPVQVRVITHLGGAMEITVHIGGETVTIPHMEAGERGPPGGGSGAVVARLGTHQAHRLTEAMERWSAAQIALGKGERTIDAYRKTINAWAKSGPFSWAHDLSYSNVNQWMCGKCAAGEWKGQSYNHALAAFRSLTRYLAKIGWLHQDTMADADRARDTDDDDGARAASTDEVRRQIAHAMSRQHDGRAKGFRGGYWAWLAYTGSRYSEPSKMLWADVDIDAEIPTILWRPEVHKLGRRMTTAMHPGLAVVLRAWREVGGSDGLIFPIQATRPAFKKDAKAAGIDPIDFSPHSFRKHMETTLVNSGVPSRLVDYLMKHSLGVQGAYYKPTLADQYEAMSQMPDVLTGIFSETPTKFTHSGHRADTLPSVTPMPLTHVQTAEPRTAATSIGVTSNLAGGARLSELHDETPVSAALDAEIGVSASLNRADPTRHAGGLNFGVAGRDNRPDRGAVRTSADDAGLASPGERPGHPIQSWPSAGEPWDRKGARVTPGTPEPGSNPGASVSRGGGASGNAQARSGEPLAAGSGLNGRTPTGEQGGFDSRPPHSSALGDFLKAQIAADRARIERDEALLRLIEGRQ